MRLVVLLLLLASQGVAGAHDLCPDHVGDQHECSICVLGHGVGAAVAVSSPAPLQLKTTPIQIPFYPAGHILFFPGKYYFSRAPPESLRAV